jgi:DNA topoisomerase-1
MVSKSKPPTDPARAAGLHYVSDEAPGIRREMSTLGFRYRDAKGRVIRDAQQLKRIRALAIPPAWTEVWICPDGRGHLQATGRDARGRKQYRYHSEWRTTRDETKFDRMIAFAAALPKVRARTAADIARPGLPRQKVLATVVQLLEKTLIRIGNEEYAKTNRSFGLTTFRDRHVNVKGETLRFQFRGKSGVSHAIDVSDRRLARIVKQCRDLPGQQLFQYVDDEGAVQSIGSADVNAYLKEITGEDFTAKDFRTWAGTVLALTALREMQETATAKQAKKSLLNAIEAVAKMLGNTRTVCRKSYIHPVVIEAYTDGWLSDVLKRRVTSARRRAAAALRAEEEAVLAVLRRAAVKDTRRKAA